MVDGEYQDGELRGCTFIAGKRGMGKTTEMGRLLSSCSGGVVFFDSLSRHESVLPGYRVICQPGDLRAYLLANRGRRFKVLYQPRGGDLAKHFRVVCVIVRSIGYMIFGIDELDILCGPRYGDSRMPPEFYHLVHFGRHCKVSMLATARRPMSVARGFTAACGEMRLFKITEKADVKYFEDYIGTEDARRLPALNQFEFLHWKDGQETELKGGRR